MANSFPRNRIQLHRDSAAMNMSNSEPIEPATPDTLAEDDFEGSDYGGSYASSGFTSLASRVMKHSHEGGRCVVHGIRLLREGFGS